MSRLHSFETELLAEEENLAGLTAIDRELIGRAEAIHSPRRVVLDMDSTQIPVYGQQEHSAYNGHLRGTWSVSPFVPSITALGTPEGSVAKLLFREFRRL